MITIELPWPSADLSPNARMNAFAHASAKKKAKNVAWGLTKAVMGPLGIATGSFIGPIKITYVFHPGMNRTRDDDNFAARMKAGRDGIALALGVDDKHFTQQPVVFADVSPRPRVMVTVEPAAIKVPLRGVVS